MGECKRQSAIRYAVQRYFEDIWATFGARWVVLLLAVVVSSLLEGIAVAMLIPLFQQLNGQPGYVGSSDLIRLLYETLNYFRIDTLAKVLAVMVVIFSASYAIYLFQALLACRLQSEYMLSWRKRLVSKVFFADWKFFHKTSSGVITSAVTQEVARVSGGFFEFQVLCATIVVVLIYIVISLLVSWPLTVGVLLVGWSVHCASRVSLGKSHADGEEMTSLAAQLQTNLTEFLSCIKYLKSSSSERFAVNRLNGVVERFREVYLRTTVRPHVHKAMVEFLAIVLLCLVIYFSSVYYNVAMPQLILVLFVFMRIFPRLVTLQQSFYTLNASVPALDRLLGLERGLNEAQEYDGAGNVMQRAFEGPISISMRNISCELFNRGILKGIDIEIPKGGIVGIAGSTGSGKTTLLNVLVGMLPYQGNILINNTVIENVPLAKWRASIGYVTQESLLINDTLRRNVMWETDYTEEELHRSAKMAFIHDIISRAELGYDTLVGDAGMRFSGGERQRIGLARAIIRNPSLLILDEATSSLDIHSETLIMEALNQVRRRCSVLVVAHRLTALRHCDYIYLLDAGKVIESGTWDSLVHADGAFRRLVQKHGV